MSFQDRAEEEVRGNIAINTIEHTGKKPMPSIFIQAVKAVREEPRMFLCCEAMSFMT